MGVTLKATVVFGVCFGIGLQYYVPPAIVAVEIGGDEMNAVVSAWMDAVSYGFAAILQLCLKPIIDSGAGWSGFWGLLSVITMCGICIGSIVFGRMFSEETKYENFTDTQKDYAEQLTKPTEQEAEQA